jgi:hypothetical protein
MQQQEFVFKYMTAKNVVTIDGYSIHCKIGPIIKKNALLSNVQHFYVFDDQQYRNLMITFSDESGKVKKLQLYSGYGEEGFEKLITELQQRLPGKSLQHLSEKDALAQMKIANPRKVGAMLAFAIITIVISIIFIPGMIHYFDTGFESATVQQLLDGKTNTRNLKLSGTLLDAGIEETTTTTRKGSTTTTVKVLLPLVTEEWTEGQPALVVLEFDEMSDVEYNNVLNQTEFTGVVRNVWWEGLDQQQRDYFQTNYGLEVPEHALLFEVTGNERNDALMFYIWLGITAFMGVIFLLVYLKVSKGK